jgi:hypothetical protein
MSDVRAALERASRLTGSAAGTVNIALARRRMNWPAIARAADDLELAAVVLRAADPVRGMIG